MSSLENQNVVIIGGTSGIGLAAAVLANAEGANVWAASRSEDRINQCRERHSGISFNKLDTHDVDGLKALFDNVGDIDHIIGAATGADRTIAPFMEQTHEQFSEAFNKFWGYTHVARQGIPYLTDNGSLGSCIIPAKEHKNSFPPSTFAPICLAATIPSPLE